MRSQDHGGGSDDGVARRGEGDGGIGHGHGIGGHGGLIVLAAAALTASLVASCSQEEDCRDGTVFLTLSYDEATAQADQVKVHLTMGNARIDQGMARPGGGASDSVEITFPAGYPEGEMLEVRVEALRGSVVVGGAQASVPLEPGCTALEIELTGSAVTDAGVDLVSPRDMLLRDMLLRDMLVVDMPAADLAPRLQSCAAVVKCIDPCRTATCITGCKADATKDALARYTALATCLEPACPTSRGGVCDRTAPTFDAAKCDSCVTVQTSPLGRCQVESRACTALSG